MVGIWQYGDGLTCLLNQPEIHPSYTGICMHVQLYLAFSVMVISRFIYLAQIHDSLMNLVTKKSVVAMLALLVCISPKLQIRFFITLNISSFFCFYKRNFLLLFLFILLLLCFLSEGSDLVLAFSSKLLPLLSGVHS